ncbi:MAG: xylulokinase [Mycobacterium sp.]|nr:xylulokinase [Mycobacterium sp.]
MGYVLGVDIGTASSKAVLTTVDGRVVARASRSHSTAFPRPGWAEHDAESLWWADFCALTAEILAGTPHRPDAVCISGIGPCVLPTDHAGTPLRQAILYGIDTRAVEIGAQIQDDLGGADAVLAKCGSVISTQAAGPKLAWIREHEPQVWADTRRFFMAHNYIVHRLTGAYVLDHQSASQCVPLYDLRDQTWDFDIAEKIAPGVELPVLAWPAQIAGEITAEAASLTGLAVGTPVGVGTIDAWAEAESVDVRAPGDLMLMYGSTMFFVCVTPRVVLLPALWSTQGNHPGQRTLAAGMASSGSITEWFRTLTGVQDFGELVTAAEHSRPGGNGLLALPYFSGERTPVADPDARGVIIGLTLTHSRADIYRALLEATAFGVRHNLSAFADAGAKPTRVVAVGGGTARRLWPQIVSDITGYAQDVPTERVGACFGDARFAALALGAVEPDRSWNTTETRLAPNPTTTALYDELYDAYLQLAEATTAIQHSLAKHQR